MKIKYLFSEFGAPVVAAVLVIGLSLFVVGCGGGTTHVVTPVVPVTPTPTSTSVKLINESSIEIWYFHISPSSSDSWGPDQLGDTTIVSPGSSFTVVDIPCGAFYDLRVQAEFNITLATRYNEFLTCGVPLTWHITSN